MNEKKIIEEIQNIIYIDNTYTFKESNMAIWESDAIKTRYISELIKYFLDNDYYITTHINTPFLKENYIKYGNLFNDFLNTIFKGIGFDLSKLIFIDLSEIYEEILNKTRFLLNRIEIYEKYLQMDLIQSKQNLERDLLINKIKFYNVYEIYKNTKINYDTINANKHIFYLLYTNYNPNYNN